MAAFKRRLQQRREAIADAARVIREVEGSAFDSELLAAAARGHGASLELLMKRVVNRAGGNR